MSNPFNILNANNKASVNNPMPNIRNAYQLLMNSKNPYQVFKYLAQNNPSLQPIVNLLNNGGNPQQIFLSMCQQKGINPNDFLKNITGK